MIVLGIDPGYERLGWGIVEINKNVASYKTCGCIKTPKSDAHKERISSLASGIRSILREHNPDMVNIEKLFFAKNRKTAMNVAEARGAIMLILEETGVPVNEFTPTEVKMGIVGYGAADKAQVAWMVKNILKIKEKITSDDALDALALCLMLEKREISA